MFTSHNLPVNPDVQRQENPFTLSLHVAPFAQGFDAHSLISVSQKSPSNPAEQLQKKAIRPVHAIACVFTAICF